MYQVNVSVQKNLDLDILEKMSLVNYATLRFSIFLEKTGPVKNLKQLFLNSF